jgi:hypothetical protein
MSRVQRIRRRRAGDSASQHDRARELAARRLDSTLEPADAGWLDDHLVGCDACRSVAAGYDSDRLALRAMRDRQLEAPRDLWARTSAAIERESAGRRGAPRRVAGPGRPRPALGLLSGVAVIAVVIGATVLSGGFLNAPSVALNPAPSTPAVAIATTGPKPDSTPILVGAGSVGWVGAGANGALAYHVADVPEVCPIERQPDCAAVSDGDSKAVDISIRPKSISKSPVRNQAVVVGEDPNGDDAVFVIALPTADPTPAPSATPTATPEATPEATPTAAPTPAESLPTPSASDAQATPTATPEPTPEPTPKATPTAPLVTPSAVPANLAIVSGVKIVGESAAYSPNGAWFAFTARPSNGKTGPDIYVWRVGDDLARKLTNDHASVFGSWVGSRVLGSRPAETADGADVESESFFLDPASGNEIATVAAGWRPVVDPDDHWAVVWDGTVQVDKGNGTPMPATGALVLRKFSRSRGIDTSGPSISVAEGAVTEFDVRWDETGRWLAIWLADATDPSIGRLSLVHLDPATGKLDRPRGAPQDVTALPGFSIADGRLAWATPPGQGGEGSRVQIVAWTNDDVGSVESGPVEGVVVIH